jgi:aminoglycoside phosphotransferase (APT) family kinase protein
MVLRSTAGAEWGKRHVARRFPPSQARTLGRVLRVVEGLDLPDRRAPVWGFDITELPAAAVLEFSAGGLEILALVQGDATLCARLDRLREACVPATFVHGDLRWENCIAAGRGLLLVDWEDAGRGPRGWDVACAIAEYLQAWISSAPLVAGHPTLLLALARHPLERMRPAMVALWTAYGGGDAGRLCELVAVRLLEIAVGRSYSVAASPHARALAQLASNLLSDPRAGASWLLS